jgi:subtilisin family serine protease
VKQYAAGKHIEIAFPQSGSAFNLPDTLNGGLISSFSSYGPTNDMFAKPAVAAAGGNILSTWPVNLGSFMVDSGTSMATPFTAGAAALILQAKGKTPAVVQGVRDLLQATAAPFASNMSAGALLQTASVQGNGLIQVDAALNTKTIVSPAQLLLNDTANFNGT